MRTRHLIIFLNTAIVGKQLVRLRHAYRSHCFEFLINVSQTRFPVNDWHKTSAKLQDAATPIFRQNAAS